MSNTYYWITKEMRDNWLALFEELKASKDPLELWAWVDGEMFLVEQSIFELHSLDEYEEFVVTSVMEHKEHD